LQLVFNAGRLAELPKLHRLLEERKRLLEALNAMYEDEAGDGVTQQAAAAIRFAEEPVP